jgi:hypothetical protein
VTAVLPPAYLANTAPVNVCRCQWGPSGTCRSGRHDRCQRTVGWERHGSPGPETHIVSRRGWVALTPVWRAGRACRWLCPCWCHEQVQALFPAPPGRPGRLSTTGGNGYTRISSTDRLRVDDEPQPALPLEFPR